MTFVGPIAGGTFLWIALGAALLAVSAYIIKMRRRRFEVPFSQLWRRVLDQKDASSASCCSRRSIPRSAACRRARAAS